MFVGVRFEIEQAASATVGCPCLDEGKKRRNTLKKRRNTGNEGKEKGEKKDGNQVDEHTKNEKKHLLSLLGGVI